MTAIEQIRQMPLQEKLLVMEALWQEISHEEKDLLVPDWHKEILDERERSVAEGKTKIVDWEEAKRQIRAATR